MLDAPLPQEWTSIYGPQILVLAMACAVELLTGKIPNWLTASTLIYLLCARWSIGPLPFGWYLLSTFIAATLAIGIVWMFFRVGAGAAKLIVAIGSGFPPGLAFVVSAAFLVVYVSIASTKRWHGVQRMFGSVVVSAIVLAVLITMARC